MCDIEFIKKAIDKAAKGKRDRPHIAKVLKHVDDYALRLRDMIANNAVTLSPNTKCEIYDESCRKSRVITIPKFYPDQIIHWLLISVLQPIMERGMYRYCCGSVPNRGGIDAKAFVETAIKDPKMRYVVKLDISKFFDSVKPKILLDMFRRKIKDARLLDLIGKVLENGGDKLPIGYYTSQWFSNFYLEGLDHYVKEVLKIRYYVRYVDDMVLIDSNKRKLHKAILQMGDYLHKIGLKLKGNWQLWRLNSRPIDFVGYRFYGNKTLLRKRIYFRLCRRVRSVKKAHRATPRQAMSLLSLIGWLSHINARAWYKANVKPFAAKGRLRKIVSNHYKKGGQKQCQKYLARKSG